jgi:hypothetical protein
MLYRTGQSQNQTLLRTARATAFGTGCCGAALT